MKEIRTTRMVEQTEVKFIADDGKVFVGDNAEKDCIDYERRQNNERIINEFKKLKPKWINIPLIDWVSSDIEIVSVDVKDEIDFDIVVKDYFYRKSPEWMDMEALTSKRPKKFPCNLVFISGYEWVDIFGSETELKEELKKTIEKLNG